MGAGVLLGLLALQIPGATAWAQTDAQLRLQADSAVVETLPAIDRARQYLARGLARKALGRAEEALVDLTLAINQLALPAPDQARALYNRGMLLENRGDRSNAQADYSGAMMLNPGLSAAAERLAALNGGAGPAAATQRPPLRPATGLDLKPAIVESGRITARQIQLGAWRSEAGANAGWQVVRQRADEILAEFRPHIVAVDLPGRGRFFRLRIGPMNKNKANEICTALKARGLDCLLTPN